jgi:bacterioferritin (cytochrome b1)
MSTQQSGSPMDNLTYDLVMSLASKLEAIDVYQKYMKDAQNDPQCQQLFQELMQDDKKHIDKLQQHLAGRLGGK